MRLWCNNLHQTVTFLAIVVFCDRPLRPVTAADILSNMRSLLSKPSRTVKRVLYACELVDRVVDTDLGDVDIAMRVDLQSV